jgi:hypothetical protein
MKVQTGLKSTTERDTSMHQRMYQIGSSPGMNSSTATATIAVEADSKLVQVDTQTSPLRTRTRMTCTSNANVIRATSSTSRQCSLTELTTVLHFQRYTNAFSANCYRLPLTAYTKEFACVVCILCDSGTSTVMAANGHGHGSNRKCARCCCNTLTSPGTSI